jgi:hypothetical protein
VIIASIITTVIVSILSGVYLHAPIIEYFILSPKWDIYITILLSLSAENIMTQVARGTENIKIERLIYLLTGKNLDKD